MIKIGGLSFLFNVSKNKSDKRSFLKNDRKNRNSICLWRLSISSICKLYINDSTNLNADGFFENSVQVNLEIDAKSKGKKIH